MKDLRSLFQCGPSGYGGTSCALAGAPWELQLSLCYRRCVRSGSSLCSSCLGAQRITPSLFLPPSPPQFLLSPSSCGDTKLCRARNEVSCAQALSSFLLPAKLFFFFPPLFCCVTVYMWL